jgi:transmembrane sensor
VDASADKPIDPDTLRRVALGDASPAEHAAVAAYLAAHPEERARLDAMRDALAESRGPTRRPNLDQEWRALASRLGLDKPQPHVSPVRTPAPRAPLAPTIPHRRWTASTLTASAFAAAAAIVVAFGVAQWINHRHAPPQLAWREYVTTPGQREIVTLADGTEFTLGPASRLRVAPDYGRSRRLIRLEGEAYFAVTHDPVQPFTVLAGTALAEDVGTHFVVRAYPDQPDVRLVVTEGAVALADSARRTLPELLEAGNLGRVDAAGSVTVTPIANVDAYVAWTRNELVFDHMPMREVVVELSRWYDLDIHLADSSLANQQLLASFKNEPVRDVLHAIAATMDATVERSGRDVVFRRAH